MKVEGGSSIKFVYGLNKLVMASLSLTHTHAHAAILFFVEIDSVAQNRLSMKS